MMISGLSGAASRYSDPTSTFGANARTPAGGTEADAPAISSLQANPIDISQLKPLQATPIFAGDIPVLRDLMATNWLRAREPAVTQPQVSDDAPQNTYAQVKVSGNVVATLYNGGSSTMTGAAAAKIGDLQDPPGLLGPDLAQWRADAYAKLLGGTVEKAATASTQSQWTPHDSAPTGYSRDQLDAAFAAMLAESETAAAQRSSPYLATSAQAGGNADVSA